MRLSPAFVSKRQVCRWRCREFTTIYESTLYVDYGRGVIVDSPNWKICFSVIITGDGQWDSVAFSWFLISSDLIGNNHDFCLTVSRTFVWCVQWILVWKNYLFSIIISFSDLTSDFGGTASADIGIDYCSADYSRSICLSRQLSEMHFSSSGFFPRRVIFDDALVLLDNPAWYASYQSTIHMSRLCMSMPEWSIAG